MGENSSCNDCGAALPLSGGRAVIRGTGVVLVCQAACTPRRVEPTVAAPPARRRRRPRRPLPLSYAGTALSLTCAALLSGFASPDFEEVSMVTDDLGDDTRSAAVRVAATESGPRHPLAYQWVDDTAVELIWHHPLAGERLMPERHTRRFGSERTGSRPECGAGHCGVDLGGPDQRGAVVHAALPGEVVRIVREADRKGGRYVKLLHPEGFTSYYMHLEEISPDLVVGVGVAAGEPLGTLGRSGIQHSAPHLHFQVARVDPHGGERFVDPEPMLRHAVLLDEPAEL